MRILLLQYLTGLWLLYRIVRAVVNISPFHPLYQITRPKLAPITFLYEAWFDLILGGRYSLENQRMHEIYGPVVRIHPEELHINDIAFTDEIYSTGKRRRNKQVHLNLFAGPITEAMVSAVDHDLHRLRRSAANKFFSRAQITKLEADIEDLADQLCDKLINIGTKSEEPIDLVTAYSCFTSDIISGYCFGEPFGFIRQKSWEPNFRHALHSLLTPMHVFQSFPLLKAIVDLMPSVAKWLDPRVKGLVEEGNEKMPARVHKARREYQAGEAPERPAIFILWLGGESYSFIAAGTETTAWTLTVITFHLCHNPTLLDKLADELDATDALTSPLVRPRKTPLPPRRHSRGPPPLLRVSQRLPRIAPDEHLTYRGEFKDRELTYVIPPGTPMGMSSVINHHNESVFPDSHPFRPERWLEADETQCRRMETCLIPFSKGSHQCLGMSLAYCSLYVTLPVLALRVLPRMRLYQTTVEDVAYDHDLWFPIPKESTKGVRVVIS
ncbi:cytochrome P450 [Aspergillus violaceofuscus CBS 115571]|uniref:Cytochrome P450 n=1 Tax=Aspergillus violaceofuscus (strain CBS 115571) TaxID=1450538 RepID=A0A2V5I1U4_ASPV1|nr:cytochrome P450 [Aspergillus violaceofuscus CBS 115571]